MARKRSGKSRRFIQHSVNAINKHAEKIPYHLTYAEAESRKMSNQFEGALDEEG